MKDTFLSVGLDIIVICLLAATIFFILRLYKGLNEFKTQRKQFDSVITNLLASINQAEKSIQTLKNVSATEAAALEKLIEESKALSEELNIINGTGESIANRIEQLSERKQKDVRSETRPQKTKKRATEKYEAEKPEQRISTAKKRSSKKEEYTETLKKVRSKSRKRSTDNQDIPSFMIQDAGDENDKEDPAVKNLESQAERELYEALRSNKRNTKRNTAS